MTERSSFFSNLVVFLFVFMHVSNITLYLQAQRIGFLQWHFWAMGIVLMLSLTLLSKRFLSIPGHSFYYLIWCTAYIVVCLLSLLFVDRGAVAFDGFVAYMWYFMSSVVLVLYVRSVGEVKACGYAIVTAVLLLSVIAIFEFINPDFQAIVDKVGEDVNKVGEANRAASLFTNQNVTGVALVLGAFIGQMFLPRGLRFVFLVIVGAAVFGTVSRSSLTLWALVVMASFWFGYLSGGHALMKIIGLSLVVGLGYLLLNGQIPGIMASIGLGDLLNRDMTERLSENFFTQQDSSSEGRLDALIEGWNLFLDNPIFGIGIGASEPLPVTGISSHNQHVEIAAELGIFGWLVFAAIALVALKANTMHALLFVFFLFLIGFTAHWVLNFPVFGMYFPAALIFLPALTRYQKQALRSKPKKRRRRRKRKRRSSYESNAMDRERFNH